ncbi:MAG TPA: glutathione peroxidase [Geminicoccaceae bacterium]
MRAPIILLTLLAVMAGSAGETPAEAGSAHDFGFVSIEGEPMPLRNFAGRPVLVVNTASLCGFTYQYAGLQDLFERYRDRGFVLIGVPSNDFGNQEPGSEAEIKDFCEVNFDIDFPLTEKQVVKGDGSHPFFAHVRAELGDAAGPNWNFHKYLVGPEGELLGAWPSRVEPTSALITSRIEEVLQP